MRDASLFVPFEARVHLCSLHMTHTLRGKAEGQIKEMLREQKKQVNDVGDVTNTSQKLKFE